MKIILSPAKKMNVDTDTVECVGVPVYLEQTEKILEWLKNQSHNDLKKLWKCSPEFSDWYQ